MKSNSENLILWYKMDRIENGKIIDQSANHHDGVVNGELKVSQGPMRSGLLFSGQDDQFITLPEDILTECENLTVMCYIKPKQIKTWQRVFDFGKAVDKNIFFTLAGGNETPMLSLHDGALQRFGLSKSLEENRWVHVAITVKGQEASILVNGEVLAHNQTITVKPTSMVGDGTVNYIGKSRHDDPLFEGEMADFKVYRKALTPDEIYLCSLEGDSDLQKCESAANRLTLGDCSLVTKDLILPVNLLGGLRVAWCSTNDEVMSATGVVNRGVKDTLVRLTATISCGEESVLKEFEVLVLAKDVVPVTIEIDGHSKGVDIPDTFVGLFFEDINYAADGGLYAELVNNRSFEFGSFSQTYSSFSDYFYAWSVVGDIEGVLSHTLENKSPIHENNPNYLQVHVEVPGSGIGIANTGFEGIAIQKGETYNFSTFVRNISYPQGFKVRLESFTGDVYAESEVTKDQLTNNWSKVELDLVANESDEFARLTLRFEDAGTLELDMVSLFPENTFNQRKNGLRADLVQLLKDINPGFIRFPGGCIVEGMVLENAYNWKHTVGPVETRKLNWNRWEGGQTYPYNQSYGLGFMEYFILAKDLNAEPLPIVNCGMSCQFQGAQLAPDFEPYIQDALDLIEFANGDETTVWGQKRIEYGHLEPFNLKYLGVGNEQWIDRIKHGDMDCLKIYELFRNRIKAVYPEINLITTSGPFPYGKEFDDAYEVIRPKIEEYIQKGEVYTEIIDEHFYMSPEWFLENLDRYDQYPRYEDGKSGKIFLGEYACHTNRNGFSSQGVNNMLAALSEAAFLTSAQRNADIIEMTTYAPLFAKKDRTQWGPDLIWFDNSQAYGTPSYYVQKMYGSNMGDYNLNAKMMMHPSCVESTDFPLYFISSFDEAASEIIVKLVNLNGCPKDIQMSLKHVQVIGDEAVVTSLMATYDLEDVNSYENKTNVQDVSHSIKLDGNDFNYQVGAYSFDVLRIKVKSVGR